MFCKRCREFPVYHGVTLPGELHGHAAMIGPFLDCELEERGRRKMSRHFVQPMAFSSASGIPMPVGTAVIGVTGHDAFAHQFQA